MCCHLFKMAFSVTSIAFSVVHESIQEGEICTHQMYKPTVNIRNVYQVCGSMLDSVESIQIHTSQSVYTYL